MNSDDFEKQLQQQPMRTLPAEWRSEILRNARQAAAVQAGPMEAIHSWWRELIRPRPVVWGTLAGAWLLILFFYLTTPESSPTFAIRQENAASSVEIRQLLVEQRQEMAHLLNPMDEAADAPHRASPGPRSERITRIFST